MTTKHPAASPPAASTVPMASPAPALPPPRHRIACISSQRLFSGAVELLIEHHGATYRLRQTSLGKLILTK